MVESMSLPFPQLGCVSSRYLFSFEKLGSLTVTKMLCFHIRNLLSKNLIRYLQGGPLPVISRVITPYKWPYKWVNGVMTLLIGVVTPLITGRGTPCTDFCGCFSKVVAFS